MPGRHHNRQQFPLDAEADANARLIVRAVNSHDALVNALENISHSAEVAATRATGFDKMALERDAEKARFILNIAKATNQPKA